MAATRKSQLDDEDFWNASSASSLSDKCNIFDENVDFESTKRLLKQSNLNDIESDDTADVINWDGSSASSSTRVEFTSARYRPASNIDARSDIGQPRSQVPISHSVSEIGPSKPSLEGTSSLSSIQDVVGTRVRQQPTFAEVAKLEAENSYLKRTMDTYKRDDKIPTIQTVRKIILGENYSLDKYKSKEEKLQLLDDAIASFDGNAILIALLFLRDTIKPAVFNLQISQRPAAVEHYINYLRQNFEIEKLMDLLGMLHRTEQAAMLKYKQSIGNKDATHSKLVALQKCHGSHFQYEPTLAHDANLIKEYIALFERQLPIADADTKDVAKGIPIFREIPVTPSSLIDTSLMSSLYYCCLYHYDKPEVAASARTYGREKFLRQKEHHYNIIPMVRQLPLKNYLASPQSIRKAHQLTEKQYVWMALSARARLKRWDDVEKLFQTKGWMGGVKMKAIVPFDRVVFLLSKQNAPRQIRNKYCDLIDDPSRRIEVGAKYGCHESVLKTYMELKDRLQLITYQSKLTPNSPEAFFAEDILRNSSIKWKN